MTTTPTPRHTADADPARLVESRVLHAVEQDEREQHDDHRRVYRLRAQAAPSATQAPP